MTDAPNIDPRAVVIRMAHEGIPLKAIMRSLRLEQPVVESLLEKALTAGVIVEMPRDDWPPTSLRRNRVNTLMQRPVSLTGTTLDRAKMIDETSTLVALQEKLSLPPGLARLLIHFYNNDVLPHERVLSYLDTISRKRGEPISSKSVEVRVYQLRNALRPYGVTIRNYHGIGYKLLNRDVLDEILWREDRGESEGDSPSERSEDNDES